MSEGTCTKNPLLTKDYADLGNYALYLPAVKSSGDIYHIAAYVLLCRHYRWAEPRVCIAFDEHDTETSAKRGQGFLDLLAIKSELVDLSYQLNSTHLNPRDKKLRETLLTTSNSHDPINQKVTTALIQRAMLGYGADKIIGVLKSGFLHKSVIEGIAKPLEKWLQHKICQIKKILKKSPL